MAVPGPDPLPPRYVWPEETHQSHGESPETGREVRME